MPPSTTTPRKVLSRGRWREAARITQVLQQETAGGVLLLGATIAALLLANFGDLYTHVRDTTIGPASLHLDLTVGAWASDGLLAIFFFVAGIELKREFLIGDLRDPRRAALPIVAAVGGMTAPALIFVAINAGTDSLAGWAVPTATDIAFALAVLAVISTHLPSALRIFLLTLAVVDDLLAIAIIAVFYTSELDPIYLLAAAVPLVAFAVVARTRRAPWWILLPLAVSTWAFVHASGVHATVAGVLLGFAVPVAMTTTGGAPIADRLERALRPVSTAVAVPVFAFFAAGVSLGGWDGFVSALSDRVTLGVIVGLFVGKTIGVLGSTWLMTRFTHAELDDDLAWPDIVGVAMLAGVGFTVALLVGELAFGAGSTTDEHAKVGNLAGSLISAVAASVVLRRRDRHYRLVHERETRDADHDGVPDVYQQENA